MKTVVEEFTYCGWKCYISEIDWSGHLCGYVRIPIAHKLHGKDYCDKDFPDFNVHGGITYSGPDDDMIGWVIGFDCAHHGDLLPRAPSNFPRNGVFRDKEFVTAELKKLVDQIRYGTTTICFVCVLIFLEELIKNHRGKCGKEGTESTSKVGESSSLQVERMVPRDDGEPERRNVPELLGREHWE